MSTSDVGPTKNIKIHMVGKLFNLENYIGIINITKKPLITLLSLSITLVCALVL